MAARRERSPRARSQVSSGSLSSAHLNTPRLTAAAAAAEAAGEATRAQARSRARARARSVPADTSPTYHRPAGVDLGPLPSGNANGQLPQLPGQSNTPGQASIQAPAVAQSNDAGLSGELVRQMLQAQDDQIRAQASQLQQMGAMLQDAIKLATANAQQAASASGATAPAAIEGGGDAAASSSDPVPMEVDSGIRSRRAENYIPQLPQLNFTGMTSRHAEIRIWTAYREELTAWLCLLDDRYAEELSEAASSNVEVPLWFLLRQSLSKFQRARDFVQLIEVRQKGASAGYELWRMLNGELSVRSRVEGQALREQVLGLKAPKHISRALDMMRWYTTELLKYDSQIRPRFPELEITEQEAILAVLRHLDEEAKRYLLLHGTTSSLDALMRGLQFYDEQLRVLTFQKEHKPGNFLNNAFADQGRGKDGKGNDGRGKDGKGKDGKGKKGDSKGDKGKGAGKRQKTPKGKGKGKGTGRGRSKSRDKSKDTCNYCHQKGHWAPDCPQKKADQQSRANAAANGSSEGAEHATRDQPSNAVPKAPSAPKGTGKTGTKSAVLMSLIPGGANATAVSEAPVFEQFLPWNFDFSSMSMHDMVFLLGMLVVLCCVSWLVWRLHGFLRHGTNLAARKVMNWHSISRARAAFRSNSGVASSEFDNWVLLDSGASVTIISEAFLARCCTVISRGKSNSPVSISTATSESLVVDEEVSCILHCHEYGGKLIGVHLKGYVSDRVPLTLISTGILGAAGWKIGNRGPLMTLVYQGTRMATHLFASCSWVYAIDSREDYAIDTMKDLGITIPPNFGSSSLVPVSPSSRPEAQSVSTTATVVKPLSNSAKVNKPALKPEASQVQATVNQCQCECEGCLIGNCPKEIKKLGLTPEVSPGCICKAVIYQTCFVPSTCAVKFHERFCNSLNMFQDSMCTCHVTFLSNLSKALDNLMLCLICLSRVALVGLLEVGLVGLGEVMVGLVRLVERLCPRHLVLKPRLALFLALCYLASRYGEEISKGDQSFSSKEPGAGKLRCGCGGGFVFSAHAGLWQGAHASPEEVSFQKGKEAKDGKEPKEDKELKRVQGCQEAARQKGEAEAVQEGQATFRPGGGQCLCADGRDANTGRVAPPGFGERSPRKRVQDCKGQDRDDSASYGGGRPDGSEICSIKAKRSEAEFSKGGSSAIAASEAFRSCTPLRGESMTGKSLKEMYRSLPPTDASAYRMAELGRQQPKTPPKEAVPKPAAPAVEKEKMPSPAVGSVAPKTSPKASTAEATDTEDQSWGKWRAPAPPTPVPKDRPTARPVTIEDLRRLESFPSLLPLAEYALVHGPWVLNIGQQISLGLLDPIHLDQSRTSPLTSTASSKAPPPPPPAEPEWDYTIPLPPVVPKVWTVPPPPPVPNTTAPEMLSSITPKPGTAVKAMPKLVVKAVPAETEPVDIDSSSTMS